MDPIAAGKLEQTCPDCGRWEAAGYSCSWCSRVMGPADWYRNGIVAERVSRRPVTRPADPPTEFRNVASWPANWGPCPYAKRPVSPAGTPVNGIPDEIVASMATTGQTVLFA